MNGKEERVDAPLEGLWGRMWAGGIANPQFAIEQVSYLLLLKQLDAQAGRAVAGAQPFAAHPRLRWESLRACPDDQLLSLLEAELVPFLLLLRPRARISAML